MVIIIFLIAHWFLSLFCQTFFLHRYAAHRMFTMNKFWERFFHLTTFVLQGSSYLNPRAYAVMHRMHHAYSDTEKDPHSPHFFRGIFWMLFGMIKTYESLRKRKIEPLPEFSHHLFEWERFDYYANSWPVRVLWGVLYTCFYFYFAPNLWFLLLLPVHYFMGPIH